MEVVKSNVSSILAAFAAGLFIYKYFVADKLLKLPPGPTPLPVFGNLFSLGADPRKSLLRLKKKYGDVFTLYMGSRRVVYLCSYDAIKEALVQLGNAFTGRPQDLLLMRDIAKGKGKDFLKI